MVDVAHLVFGSVQPGRTVGTELSAVEAAVSAGTQRARQRGVQAAAEHAGRQHRIMTVRGGALDAARVNVGMTADTEVDAAWNGTRRAVDNCRTTELKTPTTDARPRR